MEGRHAVARMQAHAPLSKALKRTSNTQKIQLKKADGVKIQKSKDNIHRAKDQKSLKQTKQPRLVNH